MICLLLWYSSLKVWKNSSWVDSFPAMNCTSSTASTSAWRYLAWNCWVVPLRMAVMSSLVNSSPFTDRMVNPGLFFLISSQTALIRWVLPSPDPP